VVSGLRELHIPALRRDLLHTETAGGVAMLQGSVSGSRDRQEEVCGKPRSERTRMLAECAVPASSLSFVWTLEAVSAFALSKALRSPTTAPSAVISALMSVSTLPGHWRAASWLSAVFVVLITGVRIGVTWAVVHELPSA